jgi:hypothetical protein
MPVFDASVRASVSLRVKTVCGLTERFHASVQSTEGIARKTSPLSCASDSMPPWGAASAIRNGWRCW